mmetsp:Transcript_29043/g.84813  ORF Transcript_29043/g.84813 Transcript_29043/m.84813 type:complete len:281 (-) Transcript_29043:100-942(-)
MPSLASISATIFEAAAAALRRFRCPLLPFALPPSEDPRPAEGCSFFLLDRRFFVPPPPAPPPLLVPPPGAWLLPGSSSPSKRPPPTARMSKRETVVRFLLPSSLTRNSWAAAARSSPKMASARDTRSSRSSRSFRSASWSRTRPWVRAPDSSTRVATSLKTTSTSLGSRASAARRSDSFCWTRLAVFRFGMTLAQKSGSSTSTSACFSLVDAVKEDFITVPLPAAAPEPRFCLVFWFCLLSQSAVRPPSSFRTRARPIRIVSMSSSQKDWICESSSSMRA